MAKITPILIVVAIILSLWFDWGAPLVIGIWSLFFLYWINFLGKIVGRQRWYIIPLGWNYSTISLLDMIFIWNRMVFKGHLTMRFFINPGMLEEDHDTRMNKLGGISIGLNRKNSIRLGFRSIDNDLYVVNSYLHFRGEIISGQEIPFSFKKNKQFDMSFRRQRVQTSKGQINIVKYWVLDEQGQHVFSGSFEMNKKLWFVNLPYWEDMTKRIAVEVEVL
jgi:hypothetical protein